MTEGRLTSYMTGLVLLAATLLVIIAELYDTAAITHAAAALVIFFLALSAAHIPRSGKIFLAVGATLFAIALLTRPDWPALTQNALKTAAFIAAFFTALTTLRNASATSPSIETCGRFLAEQPPGRRYLALTTGGHIFALILNYGSISLLGSLAESATRREANIELRTHRLRRMLLAIQRGFISILPWSPLTFAVAISTSLVPGATWTDAVGYCLISALILVGAGYAMDTIFKPRLSAPPPPRAKPTDTWATLLPLLGLLAILVFTVGVIQITTGVRAVGAVMVVVPIIALCWVAIQNAKQRPLKHTAVRAAKYLVQDLPGCRTELVLLIMAGFIGTLGAGLLAPLVATAGLDLERLPGWLILVSLVWLIPITGQLGMNPILSVSLITPLLPEASDIGITPSAIIVALTAGWALSGASSPYTATTMLVGKIGDVTAQHVGLNWNGAYTLVCATVLSAWVVIVAGL